MTNFAATFLDFDPTALESFLKHGIPGLVAILAILAFMLLAYGIYNNSLRVISVVAIVGFMVFSCVLVVLTQIPPPEYARLLHPPRYVIVNGKILGPPNPAFTRVLAVRRWYLDPPDPDGKLRLRIDEDSAQIRLLFWTEGTQVYGQAVSIEDNRIKDGSYSLGEIRLQKDFDPRLSKDVENSKFALNSR